ncbi:MAG: protease complex subunit PrcB family protein [Lachnospiraceae bacterium]
MGKKKKWILIVSILTFFIACLIGCEVEETSEKKIKDLEFTVCDESRLPDALVDIIKEKKKEPFKLTYRTKDYMYIVVGYGASDRTDISVTMTDLYLTENAVFVNTDLVANGEERLEGEMVSYPWIAVKCELYDVQVVFQ